MKSLSFISICVLFCILGPQLISCASPGSRDEGPLKCFFKQDFTSPLLNVKNTASFNDDDSIVSDNVACQGVYDYCYTLWLYDNEEKALTVKGQGCFTNEDGRCTSKGCSITKLKKRSRKHFCCCNEDYCNDNVMSIEYQNPVSLKTNTSAPMIKTEDVHPGYSFAFLIFIPVAVATFFLSLALIFTCWLNRRYSIIPKHEAEDTPSYSETELDNLKILESLASGCYGCVYHGRLNEVDVAVKVFNSDKRDHFLNERSIYLLPLMEHPTLLQYIGSKEQAVGDGISEYMLVVSYSPFGSLQDYLQENTYNFEDLCKMIASISCGLDYLHTKIEKGGQIKPCVVHRDLNSRNILLKADGNCMLSDFGFAVPTSNFTRNEHVMVEQEPNLLDICSLVGTWRYMAPEILQGAINLQGCENALKQIDVYALGLVIWEVATRCFDLYQGDVPPYKLPYEAEAGKAPNMEQMQRLVARSGCRPAFPRTWKMSNLAVLSLKETIEECWDSEPEGRLTTFCVRERINQLSDLWDQNKDTFYYNVDMESDLYDADPSIQRGYLKQKSYDNSHESGYFTAPNSSSEVGSQ